MKRFSGRMSIGKGRGEVTCLGKKGKKMTVLSRKQTIMFQSNMGKIRVHFEIKLPFYAW